MITLTANEAYNSRFAPVGAKKAYVARITGRSSKMTFEREFLGKGNVDVDTPGLYETRSVDKKGRAEEPDYILIMQLGDDIRSCKTVSKEDAMKIAKALDAGRRLEEIVEMTAADPAEGKKYGVTSYSLITPRQAETKAVAQTIDTATEACWAVLAALPEKEAKKVLANLKGRVSPPKPAIVPALSPETPVGIVADHAQGNDVNLPALEPTPVQPFAVGNTLRCLDDSNGANFLVSGQTYTVAHVQTDSHGQPRVCLAGMNAAWEVARFERVSPCKVSDFVEVA